MEEQIESTRSILDELVLESNAPLYEGKILEVSRQLDDLIISFYEGSYI